MKITNITFFVKNKSIKTILSLSMGAAVALEGTLAVAGPENKPASDYPYTPAALTNVTVTGGFWLLRVETNRLVTVKSNFEKCELARIPNFRNAAARNWGTFKGIPFDDSDVFKVIEGAAYTLATNPDKELEKYVDGVNAAIAGAQEPDGYLYTARTLGLTRQLRNGKIGYDRMGPTRWSYLAHSHEFYNVGHLYEAAVAYYEATGNRTLLDVAIKSADLIDRTFGPAPSQLKDTSGHQEIELALCKLYRVTGEKRYLNLAKFLLDMRGQHKKGNGWDYCSAQSGALVKGSEMDAPGSYFQTHLPVINQREAVGHAVRAAYLYCGMADVAALAGNSDYVTAINAIWENVAQKKLALNGSVGSRRHGEAFGANYELPNATAYLETCAGIGNVLWNERMFLMHGDAKYIDVMERALYNGVLSGVSLSGDEFFYPNPLSSKGGYKRSKWFACSCCPVNVVRIIPQVAQFAYATRADAAYVNLFVESDATLSVAGGNVKLSQKTQYPWNGSVKINVADILSKNSKLSTLNFKLNVRIPGWCVGKPVPSDLYEQTSPGTLADYVVKVNGKAVKVKPVKGYCVIDRAWKSGDIVEVEMNMPVKRIKSHENVTTNKGRLAVERGPIVYCAEGFDNADRAYRLAIPADATFTDATVKIGDQIFPALKSSNSVTLIPYCVWGNRKPGNEMQTWFLSTNNHGFTVSASHCFELDSVDAAFDGILPKSSNDESIPRFTFWDHCGTEEWLQCDFQKAKDIRGINVYWFDDTGNGRCRLPESWKVEWRPTADAPWREVNATASVEKDVFCKMVFPSTVKAQAVRVIAKLKPGFSTGILECTFEL